MTTVGQWIEGARPRTLPAAVAPVLVGTGAAAAAGDARPVRALLALVVSLALQVGVNYANDYSDGIRGTDTERVGPLRLVGSGVSSPAAVKRAALAAFAVAAAAGLVLAALTTWWLVAVGAAAMLAAWFYTGGSRPYGYRALGEISVFVFFGLVATVGTAYVQVERVTVTAVAGGVGGGALACALLVVNNLRDIPTDSVTGKRTLAVVLGEPPHPRPLRRPGRGRVPGRGRPGRGDAVDAAHPGRRPARRPPGPYGRRRPAGSRPGPRAARHRPPPARLRRPARRRPHPRLTAPGPGQLGPP